MEPELNYEVASPEEGRAAVEELHQKGAEQIKVYLQEEVNGTLYPMIDQVTLNAIVETAHQLGLPVRAHVTYIPMLEMAISAEVDTIEHIPLNLSSAEMDEKAAELDLLSYADWIPALTELDAVITSLEFPRPFDGPALTDALWAWNELIEPDGQSLILNPDSYTLRFFPDGSLNIVADCNVGQGTYTINEDALTLDVIHHRLMHLFC